MPSETIALASRISTIAEIDSRIDLFDVGASQLLVSESGAEFIVAEDGSTFIGSEQNGGAERVELDSRIFD